MLAAKWIKEAQKAGWLVKGSGPFLRLQCTKIGCLHTITRPINDLGQPPEPCSAPHISNYARPVFQQYEQTVEVLRSRRKSLGLSQEDVCAASGLADGHINKLENFDRIAHFSTLQLWAETLGLAIAMNPAPMPQATLKAIEGRAAQPYQQNQARFKDRTTGKLLL